MSETWPKLSEQLDGPRGPDRCQSCGAEGWPDLQPGASVLTRWIEHDDEDRPTRAVVILCRPCSDRIIEPHPRLYSTLEPNRPHPGASGICADCSHRAGVRCAMAGFNGGPGVVMTGPKPTEVHLCRSPRRLSGWVRIWRGPPRDCDRREVLTLVNAGP